MNFISLPFLIFFIFSICLFFNFKNVRTQNLILLILNFLFYALFDLRFLLLLIFEIVIFYFAGLYVNDYKKIVLSISIPVILGILGIFKYYNFFISSLGITSNSIKIALPIGISFYSFLGISYIIDVSRNKIKMEKDIIKLALYISFFPHILSGPITKATDFIPQLYYLKKYSKERLCYGVQVFVFGAFKKIVIADRLSVYVDTVYKCPNAYNGLTLLCVSVAYSIQLYCDFSGYSDMAIGLAHILGFDLKRNFNIPYISKNLTEFWKRWHISLSEWLQSYLYISLGGNRKGQFRTYLNLMITMLLGGLWHGADWKFLAWGGLHGLGLVFHKLFMIWKIKSNINSKCNSNSVAKMYSFISSLLTFSYVNFCWILFRADSFNDAFCFIKGIFTWQTGINYIFVYFIIYLIVIIVSYIIAQIKHGGEGFYPTVNLDTLAGKTILLTVILIIVVFGYYGSNVFIYSQF